MSHTYATLPVSRAAFNEILKKLLDAGYEDRVNTYESVIDMHGLGLVIEEEKPIDPAQLCTCESPEPDGAVCMICRGRLRPEKPSPWTMTPEQLFRKFH